MSHKVKVIVLSVLLSSLTAGCGDSIPKCGDKDTLKLAKQLVLQKSFGPLWADVSSSTSKLETGNIYEADPKLFSFKVDTGKFLSAFRFDFSAVRENGVDENSHKRGCLADLDVSADTGELKSSLKFVGVTNAFGPKRAIEVQMTEELWDQIAADLIAKVRWENPVSYVVQYTEKGDLYAELR